MSYLRPFEIERFARTYSKAIMPVCLPFLRERNAAIRNARKMATLFGRPEPLDGRYFKPAYEAFGLATEWGPYDALTFAPGRQFTAMDFLALNGDFHWLEPLDVRSQGMNGKHWAGTIPERLCAATPAQMDELQNVANKLGLKLPAGFTKFMTDRNFQSLIINFELGPLQKLKRSTIVEAVDGEREHKIDGYVIMIYTDPDW
jgi:hypothetical protein